jgi:hypothetical protein
MNKQFKWLLTLVLVFMFSCSDDFSDEKQKNEGMVDFTVKTSIPTGIKTYASDNGGAANVDPASYDLRYILEVWTKETTPRLAYRGYKIVPDNFASTTVTFSARLLALQYDFVFWADFVNEGTTETSAASADKYYKTNNNETTDDIKDDPTLYPGLTAIEIKTDLDAYGISNEARDAYYATKEVDLRTQSQIESVTLTRPFGKYRIIATDVPDGFLSASAKSAKITYTAALGSSGAVSLPGKFNALSGEVDSSPATRVNVPSGFLTAIGTTETVVAGDITYGKALLLGFDYVFADVAQTVAFDVNVYSETTQIIATREISNISIVRNKLTTIIGNFFTNNFTYTVSVDDVFDEGAIAIGIGPHKTIIIDPATQENDTIFIVNEDEDDPAESITFILTGNATKVITIEDQDSRPYTGKIVIGSPKAKRSYNKLIINLPGASVKIYDDVADYLDATTSSTTLIIAKEAIINKCTVRGGNVNIFGKVTGNFEVTNTAIGIKVTSVIGGLDPAKISEQPDTKFFWWTATADELRTALAYLAKYSHGVILIPGKTYDVGAGIERNGDMIIIGNGAKIDGVSPALQTKVTGTAGKYPVIYITGGNVTLKNLTVSGDKTPGSNENVDGITATGSATTLTLTNVTIDGIFNAGGPNTLTTSGYGVTLLSNACLTATNSTFKRFNIRSIMLNGGSNATIDHCSFIGNNLPGQYNKQVGIYFTSPGLGSKATGIVSNSSFKDFYWGGASAASGNKSKAVQIATTNNGNVIDGGGNTCENVDAYWHVGS